MPVGRTRKLFVGVSAALGRVSIRRGTWTSTQQRPASLSASSMRAHTPNNTNGASAANGRPAAGMNGNGRAHQRTPSGSISRTARVSAAAWGRRREQWEECQTNSLVCTRTVILDAAFLQPLHRRGTSHRCEATTDADPPAATPTTSAAGHSNITSIITAERGTRSRYTVCRRRRRSSVFIPRNVAREQQGKHGAPRRRGV